MSHGDRITELPAGFRVVASSEGAPFAPSPMTRGTTTAPCFTRKWCTRRMAAHC